MKKALITGITGQDGSYLAEFLLGKGYKVYGENAYKCDVGNKKKIIGLIEKIKPDEIYHLAAKHDLENSLENYSKIQKTNINSTYYILEAIKKIKPSCKLFFASSSRIFGAPNSSPQNEQTIFNPDSLYGISKVASMNLIKMYRENYGIFACSGILYNHESPRRDFNFLPRKITQAAAKIKFGKENKLILGNIEAKRDWGFAGDYVEAIWLMLQTKKPEDYVIGTGKLRSVKDILNIAFGEVGLNWRDYIVINKNFFRKEGKYPLVADISKIKKDLKWQPKISFEKLIKMMVQNDLKILS